MERKGCSSSQNSHSRSMSLSTLFEMKVSAPFDVKSGLWLGWSCLRGRDELHLSHGDYTSRGHSLFRTEGARHTSHKRLRSHEIGELAIEMPRSERTRPRTLISESI
jgi:hypothetical protein